MRAFGLRYHPDAGWSGDFPSVDAARSLTFCFGAPSYRDDPEAIRELHLGVGGPIVGCSTAGEIHGVEVHDGTLSAVVVEFATTSVAWAAAPITAVSSFAAGAGVADRLAEDPELRGVFVLSDGLDVNGTDLVRGFASRVPPGVVVTGGLAADAARFEQTWVLVDGKPASGFVTAVGLSGPHLRVGHGSKGGWDRFGPERTVTRSAGNVVYELDGQPVLDLYKRYLGELAAELPASALLFPLSLRSADDKHLVRTVLAVDEDARSLTFAGDVPQGHRVRLMQANFDRLVDGAEDAAHGALDRGGEAAVSIAISCVGRRLVLGERTEDELEATMHVLPDGVVQAGFYSYGEISPYAEGSCDLHNQTMTLTTLAEVPG